MYIVISDITARWYDLWNTTFNFCNGKKMICAFIFIISNHYEMICLSNLLQLEPYNEMLKEINMQLVSALERKWFSIDGSWNNVWNKTS